MLPFPYQVTLKKLPVSLISFLETAKLFLMNLSETKTTTKNQSEAETKYGSFQPDLLKVWQLLNTFYYNSVFNLNYRK